MSVIQRIDTGVTFYGISATKSPGGDCPRPLGDGRHPLTSAQGFLANGTPIYSPFDNCHSCGAGLLTSHLHFTFYHSPADIENAETMGGIPSEWRPAPHGEEIPIPGDVGPNRVGYWRNNEAVVQVHDGADAGFYIACHAYTITLKGMPYSLWVCRRDLDDPCDEEFMREISS